MRIGLLHSLVRKDEKYLIEEIRSEVWQTAGRRLVPEVRTIGGKP